ncbi:EamA family transporter RarD [Brevundimonas basaltis]|uniref:Chloramphenicol-sensitive protein RarD n=1 Tax=Brevundimonas basaltis TaxID=472166 RepID=A0A7W8HZG1_9CAUL|nr:EamA family transporter RarD [Brevundimonas basaltis]MBB5291938.1 chloramphenicol-sensitive protein RarD [Brevundimonas basaltis]
MSPAPSDSARAALLSAFACYTLWGFMPLFFMGQASVGFDSLEILAHRALWAVAVAGLLVWLAGQGGQIRTVLTSPKTLAWLAFSTALIGLNWGLYVWATTHGATLEASLGYYINPLLNMVVGLWLFRERIDRWGWIAIGLAAVGVLFQTLALGRPPWISLILAVTFATYGVIRKRVPIDAQAGLLVECLLLAPFGLAWVLWLQHTGAGVAFDGPVNTFWALANGPATVLPLALFAWSARRLPLSTIGFIQFLAPTLQFGVGVWAGEALTPLRVVSFAFIWGGAGVFAAAAFFRHRAAREALKRAAKPV